MGATDRSEASLDQFYTWLGPRKAARIRLVVMDMWKPFRLATARHAPQASILFDKFHILRHLGDALDQVRKREYARVSGRQRRFIKGQKYTLLAHRENLTLSGRRALKTLLAANKRLHTAVPAQGIVRPALGLRPGGLGTPLLRALAGGPQVATSGALREVRGDD